MYDPLAPLQGSELEALHNRGRSALPGGVCSSTRFNRAWNTAVYAVRAAGSRFWDAAGREFLDMSMSHGATLLGHGHPSLQAAFERAIDLGGLCSFDTAYHIQLAEQLCEIVPCGERVRYTSSGSEATLHALRLCRAVSGRDKIIRFRGHFHGYHEFAFVAGHPPADQLDARPPYRESAGIPSGVAELVIPVEYNDFDQLASVVQRFRDEAGTILIEPVDYNCGCILPEPGFLQHARSLADEHDMLLFFDEIQSFAKLSPGGAQQDFGVTPDICTIGKSLGGGQPLSAILGRSELMDQFQPVGPVAHSGTFNAPLPSILSGLAFVQEIRKDAFWAAIHSLARRLENGLSDIAARSPIPVRFQQHGSRFGVLFGTREPVTNYRQSLCHSRELMLDFCRETTARQVYFHDYGGGACHHGFSISHTAEEIDTVLQVIDDALNAMPASA